MPNQTYREIPLIFQQGQISAYEESLLPEGAAAVIENWVPEPTGGVRVREGWKKSSRTGAGTVHGLGATLFSKVTTTDARQRASGSLAITDGGPFTPALPITWSNATLSGSLLVLKLIIWQNQDDAGDVTLDSTNYRTNLGGYNLISGGNPTWFYTSAGQFHSTALQLLLVKENAASETSSNITLTYPGGRYSTVLWQATELREAVTGVGKNLMDNSLVCPAFNDQMDSSGWTRIQGGTSNTGLRFPNVDTTWTFTIMPAGMPPAIAAWKAQVNGLVTWEVYSEIGTAGFPVTPSTAYTFSFYAGTATGTTHTAQARIRWYDVSGTFISEAVGSTVTISTALTLNAFRPSVTATAPVNAAFATVAPRITNATGSAIQAAMSAPQLEQGSSATSFEIGKKPAALDWWNRGFDQSIPINISDAGNTTSATFNYVEARINAATKTADTENITFSNPTNGFIEDSEQSIVPSVGDSGLKQVVFHKSSGPGADSDFEVTPTFIGSSGFPGFPPDGGWIQPSEAAQYYDIFSFKFSFNSTEAQRLYVAAQDDTTSFTNYYITKGTLDAGTWTSFDTVTANTEGVPVAFATGLGRLFYTHPNMQSPKYWIGPGTSPTSIPVVGYPGRAAAFYKSRFFTGGHNANGTRLYYSNIADITAWPSTNFLEIGQDDGFVIEDMAPQENLLIIGKQNGIYSLSGAGADTFALFQFTAGQAAPGRSICPTPYGAIVAGITDVWQLSGTAAESISKTLGAAYRPTGYVFTAYADEHLFIVDQNANKMFVCDLRTQAWHIENHVSANNQLRFLFDDTGRILGQPNSSGDTGYLMYKDLPSLTRTRDFAPLASTAQLETGQLWATGPASKMSPRHLFLQVRQRGSGNDFMTITPFYDGVEAEEHTFDSRSASGVYRERIDLGHHTGVSSIEFVATGPDTGNQFDIESAILGYIEEEIR